MKTLLLLRHGKSSWSDVSLADHDRPLKKRGVEAAKRMGQLLTELNLVPDHILTSSAVRATATVQLVVEATKYAGEVEVEPELYSAERISFLAIVSQTSNRVGRVLVVIEKRKSSATRCAKRRHWRVCVRSVKWCAINPASHLPRYRYPPSPAA